MKLDISVVGLLNVDLIIRGSAPRNIDELISWTGETEITCLMAGAAGYLIQNLVKLGNKTGIITNIGDDAFSLIIRKTLEDSNIDTSRLRIQKNTQTAIAAFVLLFGSNKRPMPFRMMTHDPLPTSFTEEDYEYIYNSRLFHHGGYLHFPQKKLTEELFKKIKEQGVKISIDPQFPLRPMERPWINAFGNILKYVDIIMVDENEALGITNTNDIEIAAKKLLEAGPDIVAIKLGAKGCLISDNNESFKKPAIPVNTIVDSIGAGDSFDSGLITGYLEGLSLEKVADLALKVASYSLMGTGGSSTIPSRDKISLD
ncbi:MAG: carbohydrate kinase family protein [Candidatus Helarchaeota archaeon]